jgi:hypothetical protein
MRVMNSSSNKLRNLGKAGVSLLAVLACATSVAAQTSTLARPTQAYCEANMVQAQRAADAAQSTSVATTGAGVGGGTLLVCMGASGAVGFTDLGMMSLLCAVAGAAATGAVAPDAAAQAAREAYLKHRDPRCIARDGR